MSDTSSTISALPACTAPKSTDLLLVVRTPLDANSTAQCTVGQLFANVQGNSVFAQVSANTLIATNHQTPANNSSLTIPKGTIWTDDNYIYVCVTGKVRRAALTDF